MVDLPNSITSGAEFTSVRRKQLKKFCLNLLQPLKLQELRENLSLMELLKSLGSEQLNSTELQCNCFGDRPGFPLPQAALSFLSHETVPFSSNPPSYSHRAFQPPQVTKQGLSRLLSSITHTGFIDTADEPSTSAPTQTQMIADADEDLRKVEQAAWEIKPSLKDW